MIEPTPVQRLTAILVIIAPMLVILYDVAIDFFYGREATITFCLQQFARKFSDLPYIVAGLLVWLWLHLFFEIVMKRG